MEELISESSATTAASINQGAQRCSRHEKPTSNVAQLAASASKTAVKESMKAPAEKQLNPIVAMHAAAR